jgi:hypothetical protein
VRGDDEWDLSQTDPARQQIPRATMPPFGMTILWDFSELHNYGSCRQHVANEMPALQ